MENKSKKFLIVIYLIIAIVMTFSTSFAFFSLQKNKFKTNKSQIGSAVMPSLSFNINSNLVIKASDENFKLNAGNLDSEASVKVTLTNGTIDSTTSSKYNVVLNIKKNDFVYSTLEKKPEIILNVYKSNGDEIKNINNLEYVTNDSISGFDITNKIGKYILLDKYNISSDSSITHNWKIRVTLVNLDTDQELNREKIFSGYVSANEA